jgi:hypothetical protein
VTLAKNGVINENKASMVNGCSEYCSNMSSTYQNVALKDHAAIENAKKVIYRVALVW